MRTDTSNLVTLDPECDARTLADLLIAEMCKVGNAWEESQAYEIRGHMRGALEKFSVESPREETVKSGPLPNRLNLHPRVTDRPEDVANAVMYAAERAGVEPVDTDYAYAGAWAAIGRASDAAVIRGGCPIGQEATFHAPERGRQ